MVELASIKVDLQQLRCNVDKLMQVVFYGNGGSMLTDLQEIKTKLDMIDDVISNNKKFAQRFMFIFITAILTFLGNLVILLINIFASGR